MGQLENVVKEKIRNNFAFEISKCFKWYPILLGELNKIN